MTNENTATAIIVTVVANKNGMIVRHISDGERSVDVAEGAIIALVAEKEGKKYLFLPHEIGNIEVLQLDADFTDYGAYTVEMCSQLLKVAGK